MDQLTLLVFASGVALVLLLFSSTVIPIASEEAERIRVLQIEKKNHSLDRQGFPAMTRIGADALMRSKKWTWEARRFEACGCFILIGHFACVDRMTEAAEGHYRSGGWVLVNGTQRRFHPGNTVDVASFVEQPVDLPLIPDDFATSLAGDSETMTFREIREAMWTRFVTKGFRLPGCSPTIMAAWPFRLSPLSWSWWDRTQPAAQRRSGRQMAMGRSDKPSWSTCYSTATHSIAIALGRGGVLTPMLAGRTANLLFASFGLYLLLKVRY